MRIFISAIFFCLGLTSLSAEVLCKNDGKCPECDVGECKVIANVTANPGHYTYVTNPSCMADVDSAQDVANAIQAGARAYMEDYAGALNDLLKTREAQNFISNNIHGAVGQALTAGRATAQCVPVCVVLPSAKKATYSSYQLEASDDWNPKGGKCNADSECPIGWSKWDGEPSQATTANTQVVCDTFMNWSGDRWRYARLTAYFRPNGSWVRQR